MEWFKLELLSKYALNPTLLTFLLSFRLDNLGPRHATSASNRWLFGSKCVFRSFLYVHDNNNPSFSSTKLSKLPNANYSFFFLFISDQNIFLNTSHFSYKIINYTFLERVQIFICFLSGMNNF